MGRKNKSYSRSLHQQAYDRMVNMQNFGTSKRKDKAEGLQRERIYSFNTFKTYYKHVKYFLKYVEAAHPECTTLTAARKYMGEWLDLRTNQGLSAWTIQTEAKALAKLYGITPEDEDYYHAPQRHREDIVRSRLDTERDAHFSLGNNLVFVKFCRSTGLRRSEVTALKKESLYDRNAIQEALKPLREKDELMPHEQMLKQALEDTEYFEEDYFVFVKGKGGRIRLAPILKDGEDLVLERFAQTQPGKKLFEYVPTKADIHSFRAEYATALYKKYARPIEEIPYDCEHPGLHISIQSGVYHCRKDETGKKLDKIAMLIASKALGHNRIEIVAENYIRGL